MCCKLQGGLMDIWWWIDIIISYLTINHQSNNWGRRGITIEREDRGIEEKKKRGVWTIMVGEWDLFPISWFSSVLPWFFLFWFSLVRWWLMRSFHPYCNQGT